MKTRVERLVKVARRMAQVIENQSRPVDAVMIARPSALQLLAEAHDAIDDAEHELYDKPEGKQS